MGGQEKEVYKEGLDKATRRSDESREARITDSKYTKSKELWKQYLAGKITADQLSESLGGFEEENPLTETILDMFEGKKVK